FALRTIGRNDVPYWAAALAAFTSYAVGHNVGASVFTGGAVRYRVYSAWGLTAIEVAKICFVAGLTFWLGNATVLGLCILYAPLAATAIDQLPAWLNRAGAVLIVIVLRSMSAGYGGARASSAVRAGPSPCPAGRLRCWRSASASSTSACVLLRWPCCARTGPTSASSLPPWSCATPPSQAVSALGL